MRVRFLGNTSCVPDPGTDTSCVLVDDRVLFDTGWAPVLRMRELGIDPLEVRAVLFSHFHQDHYLGLVQVLFMHGLRLPREGAGGRRHPLIGGPQEHLGRVVGAAQEYLQLDRFAELALSPELRPLTPGDALVVEGLEVRGFAARHVSGTGQPEPALAYRVTEPSSGAAFFFSGDTHSCPELAVGAEGVDLLIHDGAHSTPEEAAATARRAGVAQLLLTHVSAAGAADAQARARAIFSEAHVPTPGMLIELP